MSEDLLSFRVVMIGAPQADGRLWSQGVMRASVPIEFLAHDPSAGAMPAGAFDIVLLDGTLAEPTAAAVVEAARALKPVPLIVTFGANGARLSGVDGSLPRPASVEEVRRLADLCIKACLPKRVLIVDDSSTMRSIVRKILSGSRFRLQVEDCADGESALAQLRSGRFGLVFVDYNMPEFNGLDILRRICRRHDDVAVVLMTSSLEPALADRARRAGAFAFLKKPFYPADIDGILERYFGLNG